LEVQLQHLKECTLKDLETDVDRTKLFTFKFEPTKPLAENPTKENMNGKQSFLRSWCWNAENGPSES
jgi:hypothetical protein